MMKIKRDDLYFAKVKPEAIIPSKRDEDAAYDLYACFDEDYMVIAPHTTKLVPTGIATAFSSDYVAIVKERGSIILHRCKMSIFARSFLFCAFAQSSSAFTSLLALAATSFCCTSEGACSYLENVQL